MLEREAVSPATLLLDAPAMPELPLPAKLPFFHKPHRNHLNPYGAPAQPPNYGHFVISAPPSNSGLSKPSMEKSGTVPASASIPPPHLAEISPAQPEPSTLPAGLAQPPLPPGISNCCGPDMVLKRGSHGCHCVYPIKLDILLLNVSSNPNWNLFLEQFASQLGLRVSQIELINFYMVSISGLNISMDITPHTGISFSASEAAGINSSLSAHKVHLDPALVGDYQLLNITWFKPPLLPQAPVSNSSPTKAPPNLPATPAALVTSKKVKRPSLVLVVGLGAIILIVAVVSVLLCFCISRREQQSKPFKETGPLGLNCPLDWDTRMKIALDAARGLAYLHEDSQPCVSFTEISRRKYITREQLFMLKF
ncbi:UNVERIFIED_CONTAM: hypothetical protein Sangu_1146000 [Sesamum angustifolium]|uniref:Receptor-like PK ALE2 N-terminal domain-containing protein n=1 Tax=Sesamum angustifolium TaxID=2727405 RepID=A0AAW2P205_9LAMI